MQLTLSQLLATIASFVYKTKKQRQTEFNKLSPVEKKIELYVQEYQDLEGWEREWSQLEESAAQSALAVLSTLAQDETFDAKTRARAYLYMGRLPNELDADEFNPWQDNLWKMVNLARFANSRKNSVWRPYDENLTPRLGNDFFVDVESATRAASVLLGDGLNEDNDRLSTNRRGVSFLPSHTNLSVINPRNPHSPAAQQVTQTNTSDPAAELSFWQACASSLTLQVEAVHHLMLAQKICEDDVEVLIESSTTLLNLIGPTDSLFSFNVLLQLQAAQASKFFQRLLSQACNAPNASRLSYCIRLHFSDM